MPLTIYSDREKADRNKFLAALTTPDAIYQGRRWWDDHAHKSIKSSISLCSWGQNGREEKDFYRSFLSALQPYQGRAKGVKRRIVAVKLMEQKSFGYLLC